MLRALPPLRCRLCRQLELKQNHNAQARSARQSSVARYATAAPDHTTLSARAQSKLPESSISPLLTPETAVDQRASSTEPTIEDFDQFLPPFLQPGGRFPAALKRSQRPQWIASQFDKTLASLMTAFSPKQVRNLAKEAGLLKIKSTSKRRDVLERLMIEHWGWQHPERIRKAPDGSIIPETEILPLSLVELTLLLADTAGKLAPLSRTYDVELAIEGEPPQLRATGAAHHLLRFRNYVKSVQKAIITQPLALPRPAREELFQSIASHGPALIEATADKSLIKLTTKGKAPFMRARHRIYQACALDEAAEKLRIYVATSDEHMAYYPHGLYERLPWHAESTQLARLQNVLPATAMTSRAQRSTIMCKTEPAQGLEASLASNFIEGDTKLRLTAGYWLSNADISTTPDTVRPRLFVPGLAAGLVERMVPAKDHWSSMPAEPATLIYHSTMRRRIRYLATQQSPGSAYQLIEAELSPASPSSSSREHAPLVRALSRSDLALLMPSHSFDLMLTAVTSASLDEELEHKIADAISRDSNATELTHEGRLYVPISDQVIRETVLPAEFFDSAHEHVLAKSYDRLQGGAQSRQLEIRCHNSTLPAFVALAKRLAQTGNVLKLAPELAHSAPPRLAAALPDVWQRLRMDDRLWSA